MFNTFYVIPTSLKKKKHFNLLFFFFNQLAASLHRSFSMEISIKCDLKCRELLLFLGFFKIQYDLICAKWTEMPTQEIVLTMGFIFQCTESCHSLSVGEVLTCPAVVTAGKQSQPWQYTLKHH